MTFDLAIDHVSLFNYSPDIVEQKMNSIGQSQGLNPIILVLSPLHTKKMERAEVHKVQFNDVLATGARV